MKCLLFDGVKLEDDLYILFDYKYNHAKMDDFSKKCTAIINSHIIAIHGEEFDIVIPDKSKKIANRVDVVDMVKKMNYLLDESIDIDRIFSLEKIYSIFSYSEEWSWKCYTFEDRNMYYLLYWETHA